MAKSENLVLKMLTEGFDSAVKAFGGLDDALEDLDDSAKRADDAIDGVAKGSAEAAAEQEKAMRRLGLRTEETAQKQKDDLLASYKAIEQSGTASPAEIGRAWDRVQGKIKNINKSIERSTESSFSRLSRKAIQRVDRISASFRRVAGRAAGIGLVGAGAAAGAVGAGVGVARGVSDRAFEVNKYARLIGESTQDFQEVAFAARSVGLETDAIGSILLDLNDRIGDLTTAGSGPLKDFFEKLGPKLGLVPENIEDLDNSTELLQEAAARFFSDTSGPIEGIQKIADGAARAGTNLEQDTFLLQAIAGDAALLRTLLADSGAELTRLREEARESGNLFSDEDIAQALELRAQFELMSLDIQGVGTALFRAGLGEGVSSIFSAAGESLAALRDRINKNADAIEKRVIAFADRAGTAFSDFISILSGDRENVETQWVLDVVEGAEAVGRVMTGVVIPAFSTFIGLLDRLNDSGSFGKITAGAIALGAVLGPLVSGATLLLTTLAKILLPIGKLAGFLLGINGSLGRFLKFIRAAVLSAGLMVGVVGGIPIAIGAAIIAAGVSIYTWWDEITAFFRNSFDAIGGWFSDALTSPLEAAIDLAKKFVKYATPVGWLMQAADAAGVNIPGFREGGYTGNAGEGDVAGVVHGREFVFSADAVRRWGVGALEALAAGVVPPNMSAAMAPAMAPAMGGGRQLGTVKFDFGGQQIEAHMDNDNWTRLNREARRRQATASAPAGRFAK